MKLNKFFSIRLLCVLLLLPHITGCKSDDTAQDPFQQEKLVTDLYIPGTTFYTSTVSELTIQGKGFRQGDTFSLRSEGRQDTPLTLKAIDPAYITFVVPQEIETAEYTLILTRGTQEQPLGVLAFRQSINLDVPDKNLMTIKGAVFCGSTPVVGAVVSDGEEVTTTDDNGYYWLGSRKYHGYVFVSQPSGYEPLAENSMPRFWQPLTESQFVCEQHNFELEKVDNDNHVMLVTADIHLANRVNDLKQYKELFIPEITQAVETYGGRPVYTMVLGDMTWDQFWYDTKYNMENYLKTLADAKIPCTFYHLPGNHDNDPYYAGDFQAEAAYKKYLGPTYYSFNLGKVHYIALDNNVYINNGASVGTSGDRSFGNYLTQIELDWLKKDLALIDKNTPVVVGLHCPVFGFNSSLEITNAMNSLADNENLIGCFEGFSNVHILTGHTHYTHNTAYSASIMEHNTTAVCATWWWTGYYGNGHISRDGTPGGYGVYEIDGSDIRWHYKGLGLSREKQFITYDMNSVKNYFRTNQMAVKFLKAYPTRDDYKDVGSNVVYINVWNWDPEWTISVSDGVKELPVKQIYGLDPLHTVSYEVARVSDGGSYTAAFATQPCIHLFSVTAPDANTTLTITVTDRFGETYKEVMSRPKAFAANMQ